MKKGSLMLLGIMISCSCFGQEVLSLDDCRQMAVEHNKDLKIAQENVEIASRMKKAAFTQFLPNLSANGVYAWNQKDISLLSENALLPVGAITAAGFQLTGEYAVLPKEAMEFDVKNVFAGTVGFTQPIYMGGKIRELYKLSRYGENLANVKLESHTTDLLIEVDEAYWRVVSVESKVALANEYRNLVAKAYDDLEAMYEAGVATKADLLNVKVKMNEAELSHVRAENGLTLSRMALNQLCGLPLGNTYALADTDVAHQNMQQSEIDMEEALGNRSEIRMLEQMLNISKSNEKLAVSRFMPNVVATGGYMISNPNVFNGFENKFKGQFTVGVAVNIPIFHFGERHQTLRAAKAQSRIASYRLDEAREKVEMHITQSSFQLNESLRKQQATQRNIDCAEENLRAAQEGFAEGVVSATELLGAQSAWLSAKSDNIDAGIDARLHFLYLQKATGNLK